MHMKMQANRIFNFLNIQHRDGITFMAGVAQLLECWIVITWTPINISFLAPKQMEANGDKALECRQNEDKQKEEK